MSESTIDPGSIPRARPFPWFDALLTVLLGACVMLAGLALLLRYAQPVDQGTVQQVRITAKPGIDLSKIEEVLFIPDYYIEAWSGEGMIRSATKKRTRVGSGLTFDLPVPMRLADVSEVKVWNENVLRDSLVDRVDRVASRNLEGERFRFELIGHTPPLSRDRQVGLGLAIAGAAVVGLSLLRFVWRQAV
jgi:hypothetical protein